MFSIKRKKGSPKKCKKIISHLKNNKNSTHDKRHKKDIEKGKNENEMYKKSLAMQQQQ